MSQKFKQTNLLSANPFTQQGAVIGVRFRGGLNSFLLDGLVPRFNVHKIL